MWWVVGGVGAHDAHALHQDLPARLLLGQPALPRPRQGGLGVPHFALPAEHLGEPEMDRSVVPVVAGGLAEEFLGPRQVSLVQGPRGGRIGC